MSDFDFAEVLTRMVELRASDVHLTAGFQPAIRVRGRITPLEDYPPLTPQQTRESSTRSSTTTSASASRTSSSSTSPMRSRASPASASTAYFQRGAVSAAFRHIPQEIKSLEELGLPSVLDRFCRKPRGFVLVTGPTGSGKTTSSRRCST